MLWLVISSLIFAPSSVYAGFCSTWEPGQSIGSLSPKDMREASGMAVSTQYPNRVYWVNDSGDPGYLFYGGLDGKNIQKAKIPDFHPRDMEALTITECPEGRCLVIGDIGDNNRKRKDIKISFLLEPKDFAQPPRILRTLTLTYPDGPHDAEAMVFLPSGDLVILTKEVFVSRFEAKDALVFTLPKVRWEAGGHHTLKKAGEIPLTKWLSESLFFAKVATDAAINPTRQVLGILTYGNAVEINLQFLSELGRSAEWTRGREYEIVPLKSLPQQETLAYLTKPDRLVWSTEYVTPAAPIFSMTCARISP